MKYRLSEMHTSEPVVQFAYSPGGALVESEDRWNRLFSTYHLWDNFDDFTAFETAGFTKEEIAVCGRAKLRLYHLEDLEVLGPLEATEVGWDRDIYAVSFSARRTEEAALFVAKQVVAYIPQIGGDDGYFDYFPGKLDFLENLCVVMGEFTSKPEFYHKVLDSVRQIAVLLRYNEGDEALELINAGNRHLELFHKMLRRGLLVRAEPYGYTLTEEAAREYGMTEMLGG